MGNNSFRSQILDLQWALEEVVELLPRSQVYLGRPLDQLDLPSPLVPGQQLQVLEDLVEDWLGHLV